MLCIKYFFALALLQVTLLLQAQNPSLNFTEVAPGVWKATAGSPEAYDLLKAAGALPRTDALAKMAATIFPFTKNDISAAVSDGKTALHFPLDKDEQLFGFGLNFQTVYCK